MSKKKALIVAINGYPSPNELPSCIADGDAFSRYLEMEGFTEIRKLYDTEATIANVEHGVDWLTDDVTEGDTAVAFFSAHGYSKEIDGCMQESLVLLGEHGQPVLWQDDRLVARSEGLPPGAFIVVCDSCYSGGMQKLVFDPTGAELARVKTFQPSREQLDTSFSLLSSERGPAAKRVTATRRFGRATRGFGVPKGMLGATKATLDSSESEQPEFNGVVLSACLETETAAASTPQTGGLSAFTCKLLESLARLPPGTSTRAVLATTETALKTAGFRQTCSAWARHGSGLLERSFLHAQTSAPASDSNAAGAHANGESRLSPDATATQGLVASFIQALAALVALTPPFQSVQLPFALGAQATHANHTKQESQELDMPSTIVMDSVERARIERALQALIASHMQNGKHEAAPSATPPAAADKKLLEDIGRTVIQLAPTVIDLFRRKDLSLPGPANDGDVDQKALNFLVPFLPLIAETVVGIVTPKKRKDLSLTPATIAQFPEDKKLAADIGRVLLDIVPLVVDGFRRKDLTLPSEPSHGEAQDKVLQVVIPIAVSVAGALFNAFKKKDFSLADVNVPEGEKALLDQLLGTLVRLLPDVVSSVNATARAA